MIRVLLLSLGTKWSLSAMLMLVGPTAYAQSSNYDFIEDGTGTILARLTLSGVAPFGHDDIVALAFTSAGATELTIQLHLEIPDLAARGFMIREGIYPADFDLTATAGEVVEKAVIVGPTLSGLMGPNGNFASIFANVLLPPQRNITLRLNFGAAGSAAPIDQIRFIPGAAIFGEWTLVPEPSALHSCVLGLLFHFARRRRYRTAPRYA